MTRRRTGAGVAGRAEAAGVVGWRALAGLEAEEAPASCALLRLTEWEALDPALACGITTAPRGDFAVPGAGPAEMEDAYGCLAAELGFDRVSVPEQVHGTRILTTEASRGSEVVRAGRADGQVCGVPGVLLAATVADCVPVFLWHRSRGRVGLVHAGWRGVAAGILEAGLERLADGRGSAVARARAHLGPAICGRCYEVDEPVLAALGLGGVRARVDLRGLLVRRALAAGVRRERLSSSRHCTSCGPAPLHSHRGSGGRAGRMAAFLGLVAPGGATP